ncbi:hypothetical protein [Anabaena azotica]|uniref:hypothetical protein n=1 Tax=Anabaena azotica TaxID=197653 RepID=UPI0039A45FE5
MDETSFGICSLILELFIFAPSRNNGKNPAERASWNIFLPRVVLPDCSSPKIRIWLSSFNNFSEEKLDGNFSNDSFMTFNVGKTNKSFREIHSRPRCANFIPVSSRNSLNPFVNSIFGLERLLSLLNSCSGKVKEVIFFLFLE